MTHSLVELIEIITELIGDWELQFMQKYAEEGFTVRQIEYIDVINRLIIPIWEKLLKH